MALSWKHVVPWANRSEFVQTYLDLYSQNPDRQSRAVDTIALWKCRATNKLSVAIESSAALTKASLLYQSAREAGELRQKDFELCYIMTLALIRFVNHITEKGQNKAFAQPVHKIAQEFGIPEWIVRLRHDGSHGSLPCLDVLSRGVQWALNYLQEVFWSQQVKEADEVIDPSTRKRKKPSRSLYNTEEIQTLLLNYQKASYKSVEEGPDSEPAREEKRALRRIEHILNSQQRNSLLRCLVDLGHLLPSEQQLVAYGVNLDETLRADPPRVPEVLIGNWKEVLQLVQEKQLTSLLLQHLVVKVVGGEEGEGDPTSLQGLLLAAWLRLVLLYEAANFSRMSEERESQPSLYSGPIEFNKDLLLATCLQTPTIFTSPLLRLVDKDSLSEDAFRKLRELEKLYRGDGTASGDRDVTDGGDAEVHTDEEEEEEQQSPRKKATLDSDVAAGEGRTNHWLLCTEPVDWEWVPIGVLPSQVHAAESASGGEHRSHGYYSSTDDEDSRSSEEEPDTTTMDQPAAEDGERSPEKSAKDDVIRDMYTH